MKDRNSLPLILYFFSGFFALILQLIWQRELFLAIGGTVYSIAIILSVWMTGMALGSIVSGFLIKKSSNPIRIFCITQIIIGFFSLLFPPLLQLIRAFDTLYFSLQFDYRTLSIIIKSSFLFLVLLIPTTLMGAGYPLLSSALTKSKLGPLYAVNTLGSGIGALLTGFIFLYFLGIKLTLMIGIPLMMIINVIGLIRGKNFPLITSFSSPQKRDDIEPISQIKKIILLISIPVLFFLSGFTSLSYELLYNRILIYFTGNATYCFVLITAIYITGLAAGAFLYYKARVYSAGYKAKMVIFVALELTIGLYHIIFPSFTGHINKIGLSIKHGITLFPYLALFLSRITTTGISILIPVISFGFLFPLVIDLFLDILGKKQTRAIGIIYAANTLGTAIGPLITGFALIGIFQISLSLRIIAGVNIGIGLLLVLLLFIFLNRKTLHYLLFILPLLMIAALFIFSMLQFPTIINIGRMAAHSKKSDSILYYEEGVYGTVSVSKSYDGVRHLKINGVGEVPTDYNSIKTFRFLGYGPFMMQKNTKDVISIAFGGGITFGSICQIPGTENVRNVEICKDVLEAAYFFSDYNHDVYNTNRNNIYIDDGRRYLEADSNKYDIIISDSTHPASADSWVLYTKEFYEICLSSLKEDGIMAQWLPLHKLSVQNYKTIINTFLQVFPEANLYYLNEYTIIMGSRKPVLLQQQSMKQLLSTTVINEDLQKTNMNSTTDINLLKIFSTDTLKQYADSAPLSTDNKSPLQFAELSSYTIDTRKEIVQSFIDFYDKEMQNSPQYRYFHYLLSSQIAYFDKDSITQLFILDEAINSDFSSSHYHELHYQYEFSKQLTAFHFRMPATLSYFTKKYTEENFEIIKKIAKIVPEDHNIHLLLGKYYYHFDKWDKALEEFYLNHRLQPDPSTYQNIIILLRRMGRHKEADVYLKEARSKYGPKWGPLLDYNP